MSESIRRSSRTNKGQPPKRSLEDEYDVLVNLVSPGAISGVKKPKTKSSAKGEKKDVHHVEEDVSVADVDTGTVSSNENDVDEEYEGEVRCLPCNTTKDNYDEEKDEGGMMIQCDRCKNWQHAACMGLKPDGIPKNYLCIECQKSEHYSITNLKDSARLSIAKAYFNVFKGIIPDDYKFEMGFNKETLASKWSLELELAIHNEFPKAKDRYTNECRRVLFLLRKPNVSQQILEQKVSFEQLVKMKPEELDVTLKQYADKVRQDAIRRTVIVMEENEQRVRRTHKGEEIIESLSSNRHNDEGDSGIISRSVDHRIFKDDSQVKPDVIKVEDHRRQSYHNFDNDDDDNNGSQSRNSVDSNAGTNALETATTKSSSESSDIDNVPDIDDDDDLNFIITGKRKNDDGAKTNAISVEANLPPKLPTSLWKGHIVFPEFASFEAKGDFYSCSNYVEPTSVSGVRSHNRFIAVARQLLAKKDHDIEGRLDRKVADDYLNKVISTRDLYLIRLTCLNDQQGFDRLNNYLLNKNKVGVLSGKPDFAKDAYVVSIDFNDPQLPPYLVPFKSDNVNVGLFAVFVVKKDYTPPPVSILSKKRGSLDHEQKHQPTSGPDLQAILNQLGSRSSQPLPPAETGGGSGSNGHSILATLTYEQRRVLDEICARNPEIAANPEGALQLVSQYLMSGGGGAL